MVTWVLKGPPLAVADRHVWAPIERALRYNQAIVCQACDGVALTGAQLLDAVLSVPLPDRAGRVGIHASRSAASVIATLAIWQKGSVYVPLGLELAPAKITAIVAGCALDCIISDRPIEMQGYHLSQVHEAPDATLHLYVWTESLATSREDDRDLCYIAHTSGSTGEPKGVRISHDALLNRIACMQDLLSVTSSDRFLYKSPSVFDVHVWEFVLPLASGAHLSIYRQSGAYSLYAIADIIARQSVTIVGFVPTLLQLLLKMPMVRRGTALRAILCGGESWSPSLARALHEAIPGCALYNSYGPTETTVAVCNWRVDADPLPDQVALGAPLANLAFLVDERRRTTTASGLQVVGELSIAGVQVASGYVQAPGQAAAAQQDRFSERVVDGMTMPAYATGDLVRLDVTRGLVFFQGREDNQVKINGVRIELEELEEAVRAVPAVERCVAFVDDRPSPQLWVAYTANDDTPVDPDVLRQACRHRLPSMVTPAGFQRVDDLPLRGTGKIDRAALIARCLAQRVSA